MIGVFLNLFDDEIVLRALS